MMYKEVVTDLDDWIIRSIQKYPLIFPNRFYVIDHMFCTIGNGYEWDEDGFLWHDSIEDKEPNWLEITYQEYFNAEREKHERNYGELSTYLLVDMEKFWYGMYHQQRNRAFNAHILYNQFKPIGTWINKFDVWMSEEYCALLNFPDNVFPGYWIDMENMMIYLLSRGKYEEEVRRAFDRLVNKIIYRNKRR